MNSEVDKLSPSQGILDKQAEIVETFELFDDWTDRYQYIIDLGRKLADLPPEQKTEENRLKGCQSQVWIVTEMRGELLHFDAISDSAIVTGLIALMLDVYSDRRPAEIISTPPNFIKQIELEEHLSPTRGNGLSAMVNQIRQVAIEALAAKLDS
ncbi:MAG: cysteine desulfuration protein SufE [Gammaproteobacteria bacterium]|jgi:cysteine desulfuration protein SufE